MPSTTTVTLANVGTYRIQSANEIEAVVKAAIESGYRLIGTISFVHFTHVIVLVVVGLIPMYPEPDSAAVYRNEEHIGWVINQLLADESLGLKREDLFITSKLGERLRIFHFIYFAVDLSPIKRLKQLREIKAMRSATM
ncbi:hypothetical protein BC937DRAFT_95308, partial [Endogone sp. FLAS-F59071]